MHENARIAGGSLPNDASAKTKTRVFSTYCLSWHTSHRAETATYRNGVCSLGARISQGQKSCQKNSSAVGLGKGNIKVILPNKPNSFSSSRSQDTSAPVIGLSCSAWAWRALRQTCGFSISFNIG